MRIMGPHYIYTLCRTKFEVFAEKDALSYRLIFHLMQLAKKKKKKKTYLQITKVFCIYCKAMTNPCTIYVWKPLNNIGKSGVNKGRHYLFSYFDLKYRLRVLVRTASSSTYNPCLEPDTINWKMPSLEP